MALTLRVPPGRPPEIVQAFTSPSVYLDHWAIMRLSADEPLQQRFLDAMAKSSGTWNFLVALAEVRRLRDTARYLTGRDEIAEPMLYLWGELIDVSAAKRDRFEPLGVVRRRLEQGIGRFKTEPDAMLIIPGKLVVCIEAKFGSGNPITHQGKGVAGEKPTDREGLLQRYLEPASQGTRQAIVREHVGEKFHSQLFRNIVFASEMANGCDWHVVNLVGATQWEGGRESDEYSYLNPETSVRSYLHSLRQECFTFRTWEGLHESIIADDPDLESLSSYVRSKSAHYRPAFRI